MKARLFSRKTLPWTVLACLCFGLAAFLRFALAGYATLGLLFAVAGGVILLYLLLPKPLRVALTVLLALGLGIYIAAMVPVIRGAAGDDPGGADYLIVLGAGVRGETPSLSMLDRLDAAETYLKNNPDCVAVLSGGQGPGELISEAEAMRRVLTARGIAPERLRLEDRATDTRENLLYSFALIPEAAEKRVAVVSSEYHLYRARFLAEKLGLTVTTVPAPTSLPVLKTNYFLREGLGIIYYHVFGVA